MTAECPLVSIVIPCFKAERYIAEAIESALGQTYKRIEVIVVDDGSTDGSVSRIRSFGKRVTCVTAPREGGRADRNRGLRISQEAFVQFLDADDLLCPGKIQRQLASFPADAEEVSYCDGQEQCLDCPSVVRSRQGPSGKDSVITAPSRIDILALLHRRELLERLGGFRENSPCAQEYELHLRMACNGVRFVRHQEELYLVRVRKGSVCSTRGEVAEWTTKVDQEWLEYLAQRGQLHENRRRAFAKGFARHARWLIAAGELASARQLLARAREIHPTGWRDAYGRKESRLLCAVGFVGTEVIVGAARAAQKRLARMARRPGSVPSC